MKTTRYEWLSSVGLLILRVGIGGYMTTHGWSKVKMLMAGEFEAMGDPIGIGSVASLVLVMVAEFVCALLVMVGLATRAAALPPVIAMAVAAFVVHGADPWTMEEAGRRFFAGETEMMLSKEPALMYLVAFLALAFTGPGTLSLDAVIGSIVDQRKEVSDGNDAVRHAVHDASDAAAAASLAEPDGR